MKGLLFGELMPAKSLCHCIVYPVHDPDYFFLCRGVIDNVDMSDRYMPCYTVRASWIYESVGFVSDVLNEKWFQTQGRGTTKLKIPKKALRTSETLNTWLADSNFRFKVEYPLAFPTRQEAVACYSDMKEFAIARMLKKLMWLGGQSMYDGPFSSASRQEYLSRLRRGWSDQFKDRDEIDSFMNVVSDRRGRTRHGSGADIRDIGEDGDT